MSAPESKLLDMTKEFVQRVVEKGKTGTTRFFRPIHGRIGLHDQVFYFLPIIRKNCDADGSADRVLHAIDDQRLDGGLNDPLAEM